MERVGFCTVTNHFTNHTFKTGETTLLHQPSADSITTGTGVTKMSKKQELQNARKCLDKGVNASIQKKWH